MTGQPAVELTDVSLAYRLSRNRTSSFKQYAIHLLRRQVSYEELWALRGLTLAVHPGEVLAVIGPNGAGKSTLMKLVARVIPPTDGRVLVRGRVAPMIELGAGFNVELTGLDNIIMYGSLLGRDPRDMRRRAPAIAEWAELVDYLDVPVRNYSSGMLARLAFSTAVDVEPDVLLVDEVLSVGDEAFRRRSGERMEGLIRSGAAVVLVSHNMDEVRARAHRVLWLDRGLPRAIGEPADITHQYEYAVALAALESQSRPV